MTLVSVTIQSVGPGDRITFAVDGVVFTITREPEIRLTDANGKRLPCVNFNEWIALRTMGFFQAHHIDALARAFRDGSSLGLRPEDVRQKVYDAFDIIKDAMFPGGAALYYAQHYPKCCMSRTEIERLACVKSNWQELSKICRTRGYTDLIDRMGDIDASMSVPVRSEIGDTIIRSRLDKFLNG